MSSSAETRPPAEARPIGASTTSERHAVNPSAASARRLSRSQRRGLGLTRPDARSQLSEIFGRSLDIAFALGLGLVFSPVIVASAIALGLSDGPVLFTQRRLGRGGTTFKVYKFRTMVPNAAARLEELLEANPELRREWESSFKLKHDPRVTRLGRFLRKTSLDELPQLWNILKGEMSLVGPRPIEPFEIEKYGRFAKHYYSQRPGLTGLWQVSGRSDSSYERRVVLDAFYARYRSLPMNLGIIFKTVRVVLKGNGAY